MPPLLGRDEFGDLVLDRARRFPQRQPEPVGNAEDVRVDGKGRTLKGDGQHDVRGLTPNAGQRFERLAVRRHLAAVPFDESARRGYDILGLHPKKTARLDETLNVFYARRSECRGVGVRSEQERRRSVYARIGTLRREYDGDEQLKGTAVLQRRHRRRIGRFEDGQFLDCNRASHLAFGKRNRHARTLAARRPVPAQSCMTTAGATFPAGRHVGIGMPFFKQKDATVPPGQNVTSGFPVLHVGDVPAFDKATWRLRIFGLVQEPFELSFDALRALPSTEWRGDIHCVTRWSKKDTQWRGVRFRDLVERAKPKPQAAYVIQHADNAYTTNLPLAAMLDDDCLVAYEFDGQNLEPIHGGPVRMLVPKRYFWKSAKWVNGLEFLDRDEKGFWEKRGYNNDADPWKEERYANLPAWFG